MSPPRGGGAVAPSLLRLLAALAVLVPGACSPAGDDVRTSSTSATSIVTFKTVSIRLAGPTAASEWCALLADTAAERARGLMGRHDLGGHVGMLFRFDEDDTSPFVMRDTPLPLSIAWFAADGRLVSTTDMEPCLGEQECRRYYATGPYRFALEVPRGSLADVGVAPDAILSLGRSCRPG